ncbi:MAG: MFS transporter [Acidobacteriota bacterium]|nr:MFS transporter [Acidobacteriota bacterium]
MTGKRYNGDLRPSLSQRLLGVDLRPDERGPVLVLFAYALVLFACFYAAKVIRQFYFVDVMGAEKLPYVYLLGAVVSYPVLNLYERMVDRLKRHHLLAVTAVLMGAGMVLFRFLLPYGNWVSMAFYVWMGLVFGIAVSQFWSYANQIFDPRQAKRLFSLIAIGCGLGGILGAQLAGIITKMVGISLALPVVGGLHLVLVVLILYCERVATSPDIREKRRPIRKGSGRGGLHTIIQSPYLRLLAGAAFLSIMAAQMLDLQFSWAIQRYTDDPQKRAWLFGQLYSLISFAALIIQVSFTARIHRTLGVGVAIRVLPVSVLLGTVFVLLTTASPIAFMVAAMGLKVSEGGLRHSVEQVTRELLYLPVTADIRQKAKTYIDVFIQRFGRGAAALLLLPVTFGLITPYVVGWLVLVIAVAWALFTSYTYNRYIVTYREGLEAGTIDPKTTVDLRDINTLELLVQSLGSSKTHQVLYGLDLLAAGGRAKLVPPLLLYHDHPSVRLKTLQTLADAGRKDACQLITKCFGDTDADVRAAAVRTMAHLQGDNVEELLLPMLRNPDPRVRAAVISYMSVHDNKEYADLARAALEEMLADADSIVRAEAAKAIGEIPEPHFQHNLIPLMIDKDPMVVTEAIHAVRHRALYSTKNPVYATILIALMRDRRWKHPCREALVALGEMVIPALFHFMNDPEEHIWVRRAAPKTIAQIGGEKAARALIDSLGDPDVFLHRKVIEALVRLRDKGLDMSFGAETIRKYIRTEANYYMQYLADLHALGPSQNSIILGPVVEWKGKPALVQQLLSERMRERLINMFGLVATLYPINDIRVALRSLLSRKSNKRGHAVEFLDNALNGPVHRYVMSVIGDQSVSEKLRHAGKTFGIVVQSEAEALRRIALSEDGIGTPALTAAAVHAILARRVSELYPLVEKLYNESEDDFIRETSGWVLYRLDLVPEPSGNTAKEDTV